MSNYIILYDFNTVITDMINADNKKDILFVLDIDETILYFVSENKRINKEWWKSKFNEFYIEYKKDYDYADRATYNEWLDIIKNNNPKHTDKEGLYNIINEYNYIFITARDPSLEDITSNHMKHLHINKGNIYHVGDNSKGKQLVHLLETEYRDIKKVIFIDDLVSNLDDVSNEFKLNEYVNNHNIKLDCYLFKESDKHN